MKTSGPGAGGAVLFFVVTYAFSWTAFFFSYRTGVVPIALLGVWAPTLSAVLLTLLFYGPRGVGRFLARFGRVKVGLHWWLALLFLPGAIHYTGLFGWSQISPVEFEPVILPVQYWIQPIVTSILIAGLGEELGWRGFALPRLQASFSPLAATLVLATFHVLWHLPTYWLGQGVHNVPALFLIGFAVPWSIIFTWIYNRSGGSLLFAVGFHAISNASLAIVRFMPLDSEVPISTELLTTFWLPVNLSGPYLSVVAAYWIVAVAVVALGGLKPANTDTP